MHRRISPKKHLQGLQYKTIYLSIYIYINIYYITTITIYFDNARTYKQQLSWCHDGMFCRPATPAIESKEFKRPQRPPQRPGLVQAWRLVMGNVLTSLCCPEALIVMSASSRWRMILDISLVPSLARHVLDRRDSCEI